MSFAPSPGGPAGTPAGPVQSRPGSGQATSQGQGPHLRQGGARAPEGGVGHPERPGRQAPGPVHGGDRGDPGAPRGARGHARGQGQAPPDLGVHHRPGACPGAPAIAGKGTVRDQAGAILKRQIPIRTFAECRVDSPEMSSKQVRLSAVLTRGPSPQPGRGPAVTTGSSGPGGPGPTALSGVSADSYYRIRRRFGLHDGLGRHD